MKNALSVICTIIVFVSLMTSCGQLSNYNSPDFTIDQIEKILPGKWSDQSGSIEFDKYRDEASIKINKPELLISEIVGTYEVMSAKNVLFMCHTVKIAGQTSRGKGNIIIKIKLLSESKMKITIKDANKKLHQGVLVKEIKNEH